MKTWRMIAILSFSLAVLPGYLRAYKISTPSETPSINIGDSILVNKAAYGLTMPYSERALVKIGAPKRGDMVLVLLPGGRIRAPKRVLGLPGETFELRENRVLVDGREVPRKQLNRADFGWVAPANRMGSSVYDEGGHWISFTPGACERRNYGPVALGQRQYFLIGDNRDESLDSRIWGPVAEDRIVGKVVVTYARAK